MATNSNIRFLPHLAATITGGLLLIGSTQWPAIADADYDPYPPELTDPACDSLYSPTDEHCLFVSNGTFYSFDANTNVGVPVAPIEVDPALAATLPNSPETPQLPEPTPTPTPTSKAPAAKPIVADPTFTG